MNDWYAEFKMKLAGFSQLRNLVELTAAVIDIAPLFFDYTS